MKDELIKQLAALNLRNSQIEKELDLPLNSLSAVLNKKKPMPDKWVSKVQEYIKTKNPPPPTKPLRDPTRPWINEIEQYCLSKGIFPDYLIEFHKDYSNSETTRAIQMLKKSLSSK